MIWIPLGNFTLIENGLRINSSERRTNVLTHLTDLVKDYYLNGGSDRKFNPLTKQITVTNSKYITYYTSECFNSYKRQRMFKRVTSTFHPLS